MFIDGGEVPMSGLEHVFSIHFMLFSGAFSIFEFFTFFLVLERNCFEKIFQNMKI